MPDRFPAMGTEELDALREKPYPEIAHDVLGRYTEGVVDPDRLLELCRDASEFFRWVKLEHRIGHRKIIA